MSGRPRRECGSDGIYSRGPVRPKPSLFIGVGLVVVLASVVAQQAKFDVASIKAQPDRTPNIAGAFPRLLPGGVFNPTHITVESLVVFAYDVKQFQVVGGPDWIRRDLFHVSARAAQDATVDHVRLMVRALLEERFQLTTRREQRELHVEALVWAHSDRRLGTSILPIDECSAARINEVRQRLPRRPAAPQPGMSSGCTVGFANLAALLTDLVGSPVVDETGTKDQFFYELRAAPSIPSPVALSDPSLPALPAALEEQLGLKLESRRTRVEFIVIDSVRPPNPN